VRPSKISNSVVKNEIRRIAEENERLINNIVKIKSSLNKDRLENEWWARIKGYKKTINKNHF
jgi:hypothetical protein